MPVQCWPQTVGMIGEVARNLVLSHDPSLKVHVLAANATITMNFRLDRVRVFVDDSGFVVRTPCSG